MKLTKRQLKKIIREEHTRILKENLTAGDEDTIEEIIEELKASVKKHESQHQRLQSILERLIKARENQ